MQLPPPLFFIIFQDTWTRSIKNFCHKFYCILWINNHIFKHIKRFYITFAGMKTSQIITDTALHMKIPLLFAYELGEFTFSK